MLARDNGAGWIETLPRHGYRYVGPPVTRFEESVGEPAQRSAAQMPKKPSIAVLPFENTGDAAWFTDGVVEDILTGLSRIKWLFVIARSSSFIYRGRAIDVKQVRGDLGVRYVLEGSVRRNEDRVRIHAQLVDAESGARSTPGHSLRSARKHWDISCTADCARLRTLRTRRCSRTRATASTTSS